MVLEIAKGTYATAFVKGEANMQWLSSISSKAVDWLKNAGKDILAHLQKVKGGAIEVWNAISSGNWGLFKSWWNEASVVEKGAGVLLAGTIIYVGVTAIGGIASGIGALLTRIATAAAGAAARLSPGARGFIGGGLSAAVPGMISWTMRLLEQGWNMDWGQSDKELSEGIKNAIEGLYNPLGEAIGRSIATVIVGRAINNTPTVRINVRQLANLIAIHGGNEAIRDSLIDAVTEIWYAVKSAAQGIMLKLAYMNTRKFGAKVLGKDDWGKEAPTWSFGGQFEEGIKTLIPDEKAAEATLAGFESFFETIGDLLTEEDVYAEFI